MKKFIKENWIAMIPYVMFVIMIIGRVKLKYPEYPVYCQ